MTYEHAAYADGYTSVCGVDEAGVGPLAGDVFAAAVILPQHCVIEGLNDSKKLTHKKRVLLREEIMRTAVAWHVSTATTAEIDRINIRQATRLAMTRAIEGLLPDNANIFALIDGNYNFDMPISCRFIVGGDGLSLSIAAASVLAKVARDEYCQELHRQFPQYGFDKHKGYPTAAHYQVLREHGASAVHRQSFRLYKD